jgi:hypothetical protein
MKDRRACVTKEMERVAYVETQDETYGIEK